MKKNCLNCKWGGSPYMMDINPKTGTRIYLQCDVPISPELHKILPASFFRESAVHVGIMRNGVKKFNNNYNDCPTWQPKPTA